MTKTAKTQIKELRLELRYWQAMARVDAQTLRRTRAKCKAIGAKMRELQKQIK